LRQAYDYWQNQPGSYPAPGRLEGSPAQDRPRSRPEGRRSTLTVGTPRRAVAVPLGTRRRRGSAGPFHFPHQSSPGAVPPDGPWDPQAKGSGHTRPGGGPVARRTTPPTGAVGGRRGPPTNAGGTVARGQSPTHPHLIPPGEPTSKGRSPATSQRNAGAPTPWS